MTLSDLFALWQTLTNPEFISGLGSSFVLIAAAEMGDKSQLVCMTLASRHRAAPVFWGALLAFALLNTLAVSFGAVIAASIPDYWRSGVVALLFAGFGIHALFSHDETETPTTLAEKSSHSIFLTTFLLITLAELGDKTQLAVVAFSSTSTVIGVWLGATLALGLCSGLGVWAGKTLLQKISLNLLHQFSAILFLILAAIAAYQCYQQLQVDNSWLTDQSHFIASQFYRQFTG